MVGRSIEQNGPYAKKIKRNEHDKCIVKTGYDRERDISALNKGIKIISRVMSIGEAKARRAKKEMVKRTRLVISIAKSTQTVVYNSWI